MPCISLRICGEVYYHELEDGTELTTELLNSTLDLLLTSHFKSSIDESMYEFIGNIFEPNGTLEVTTTSGTKHVGFVLLKSS